MTAYGLMGHAPLSIHLAKTMTHEVGHLLGTGPMYGEYITFSIEEMLELEFKDIDSKGD